MDLETLSAPLEIKLAGNTDAGEFEGYGAFFGNIDSHGDTIAPGAFKASLDRRVQSGLPAVPMHFNHGLPEYGGEPAIGVWKAMSEDSKGLHVRGRISGMNTDRGRHYYERVKDGAISGLSIGYRVPAGGAVNGKRVGEPRRLLKAINLHEVSIVDEPSNSLARVGSVKLAARGELETLLRKSGLSKAAARQIVAGGWAALSDEPQPSNDPMLRDLVKALDRNLLDLKGLNR
ncbi:HK97 family phage prohead protease [Methylobacterium sp. Leaf106]|uniref:HK97 family phage prohead protease n=1 Tax=Methylobacterium sp. Leaf106 TaxID=1736255 RepID=UPI0006FA8DE9|nr:HK97 family phage prohead protease [Methylobacterium sp. Leaf106]KQP53013.1 hypothetical protein ASF34_01175 [Methylobacterium sp. Leaf106]